MNLKSFFQCFGLLSAVVTTNLLFSPAATASNKYLTEGIFKFEGRSAIYYSNGEGEYCWYKSWNDYVGLTGNSGWRNQAGTLRRYVDNYDGACMGGPSDSSYSHPDPNF